MLAQKHRWPEILGLAVLVVLLGHRQADAQYALGDGRGLDANLQAGSGGYNGGASAAINGRVNSVPGRYADAVVTGNVGGLKRFHGDLGYRASGDFSGSTGSDQVYLFNLRSAPAGRPMRDGGLIYRRPGSGVNAGDIGSAGLRTQIIRPDATAAEVARPGGQVRLGQPVQVRRPESDEEARRGRLLEVGVTPLTNTAESDAEEDPIGAYYRSRVDELDPNSAVHLRASLSGSDAVQGEVLIGDLSRRAAEQAFAQPGLHQVSEGEDSYFDLLRRLGGTRQSPKPSAPVKADIKDKPTEGTGRVPAVSQPIPGVLKQPKVGDQNASPSVVAKKPVRKFEYNFPPIKSLAGKISSPFNKIMKQAELSMRSGRYFQAEHEYGRAMLLRSEHPMAQAGRVHAQMGSGLYLSAAHNLRRLLASNTVVVPVRYDQALLPGADRLLQLLRPQPRPS